MAGANMDLTENMLALEPIWIWTLGLFWGSLTQALHTTGLTRFLDFCSWDSPFGKQRAKAKHQHRQSGKAGKAKAKRRQNEGKQACGYLNNENRKIEPTETSLTRK